VIRFRNPIRDNPIIFRLIKEELLPYTRQSFPSLSFSRRDVRLRLRRGVTYVLKPNNRPAFGFIHLLIKGRNVWIDMIVVDPRKQGKGWGKVLLARAERYGKRKGCTTASLYVDTTNDSAQRFYTREGYRHIRYEHSVRCYLFSKSKL